MIKENLIEYIKELVNCSENRYEISIKDIEEIAKKIEQKNLTQNMLDYEICYELEKYKKEK